MFKIPKIVAIICASVVATAAVAGAGVAIATAINSETPFEKTMKAIVPEIEFFEKAAEEGAEYDLNVKIDEELFGEQFPASIEVDFNTKINSGKSPIALVEGTVIIGDREKISVLAISESEKELQLKCQELLGDTVYSVPLTEKIIEEIDASPFAPNSGSKYAMPQELYDGIKNIFENAEDVENTEEYMEVFNEAFENIEKKWLKTLEIEKDKKEIELYDGKTKATVYTLTLDQNSLIALIDIALAEWEENEELQAAVYAYIETMDFDYYITDDDYYEITDDEEESQTPEEIISDFIEGIEETKSEIKNIEMDIVINYAEKSGYMVALQTDFEFTDDTEWGKVSFDWIFSSNPEKNPGFTMTISLDDSEEDITLDIEYYCVDNGDDGTTKVFEGKFESSESDESVEFNVIQDIKKDNSYELKASIEENSVEIGAIRLTGEYALEKDSMKIVLNELKITGSDNEVLTEVDEICVTYSVNVGKQQIELMENTQNVFALKEEDIDKLLDDIEDNFNDFIEDIVESFYEDAIQDTVTT